MMATVLDFAGEKEKGMASWLDFYKLAKQRAATKSDIKKEPEKKEYNKVKEDSRMKEHEVTSTTQDVQGRQEGEEHEIEEECKYKKRIQKEGKPDTKPVNGDKVIVEYTSISSKGSKMVYEHDLYTVILGATPTTKGFESAILFGFSHQACDFQVSCAFVFLLS